MISLSLVTVAMLLIIHAKLLDDDIYVGSGGYAWLLQIVERILALLCLTLAGLLALS